MLLYLFLSRCFQRPLLPPLLGPLLLPITLRPEKQLNPLLPESSHPPLGLLAVPCSTMVTLSGQDQAGAGLGVVWWLLLEIVVS